MKKRVVINAFVLAKMDAEVVNGMTWLTEFGPVKVLSMGYNGMGEWYLTHQFGTHYVTNEDLFEVDA